MQPVNIKLRLILTWSLAVLLMCQTKERLTDTHISFDVYEEREKPEIHTNLALTILLLLLLLNKLE